MRWRPVLLGVEDGAKEQERDGAKNDVVGDERANPKGDIAGVELGGEDASGGLDRTQQGGKNDREKEKWKQQFAGASAQAERSEEGAIHYDRPGPERQDQQQKPRIPERMQVIEDGEHGGKDKLDDGDKEKVCDSFAEEKSGGG